MARMTGDLERQRIEKRLNCREYTKTRKDAAPANNADTDASTSGAMELELREDLGIHSCLLVIMMTYCTMFLAIVVVHWRAGHAALVELHWFDAVESAVWRPRGELLGDKNTSIEG
jgi:hypothetical protein